MMQKSSEEMLEGEEVICAEALGEEDKFLCVLERALHALTTVETLGENLDVVLATAKEQTASSRTNTIPRSVVTACQQRIKLLRLGNAKF